MTQAKPDVVFPKGDEYCMTKEEEYALEIDEWLRTWSENMREDVNFVEEEHSKCPWVDPYKVGESDFDEMEREECNEWWAKAKMGYANG